MGANGDLSVRAVRPELASLLAEAQSYGVRVEEELEGRRGGAGPSDAGMVWIEGLPITFPFVADYVARSPFVLRREEDGWGLYRDGHRVASADIPPRPKFYGLSTADGIPYWKIALLHLDSLASTVIQRSEERRVGKECRL